MTHTWSHPFTSMFSIRASSTKGCSRPSPKSASSTACVDPHLDRRLDWLANRTPRARVDPPESCCRQFPSQLSSILGPEIGALLCVQLDGDHLAQRDDQRTEVPGLDRRYLAVETSPLPGLPQHCDLASRSDLDEAASPAGSRDACFASSAQLASRPATSDLVISFEIRMSGQPDKRQRATGSPRRAAAPMLSGPTLPRSAAPASWRRHPAEPARLPKPRLSPRRPDERVARASSP